MPASFGSLIACSAAIRDGLNRSISVRSMMFSRSIGRPRASTGLFGSNGLPRSGNCRFGSTELPAVKRPGSFALPRAFW
jgi:hypothetical protein